jgi:3-dehydroquinate dehydratase-2
MSRRVWVLQGPNLNLLGTREPDKYGSTTLPQVVVRLDALAVELELELEHLQSNHEGALVDAIQRAAQQGAAGVVINPGAYTHTSVAIRDALVGTGMPFVEIHISNVHAREPFRRHSYLSDVAAGVVVGFGVYGYELALRGLASRLSEP